MGLDARGDISVAELLVYVPLLFISIFLVIRHGLKRSGYVYLLLLSIVRIVGAVTHIVSEESKTPNKTLYIIFSVMEAAGLSPLLLATQGFLGTVKQIGFEEQRGLHRAFILMGILTHIGLGLTVSGGVTAATNDDPSKAQNGVNMKHIGVILFLIAFASVVIATAYLWSNKIRILKHRRTLLLAVTASIPFLAVRVLYSILSSFAPSGIPGVNAGDQSLSAFNSTTGSAAIYLIMSVIMEFIVVVIYVSVGIALPLDKDYASSGKWDGDEEGVKLNAQPNVYAAPSYPPPSQSSAYAPRY